MPDLLEYLGDLVLSVLGMFLKSATGDGCGSAGWRFFLPFMTSVWIVVLIECLGSESAVEMALSVPIILAGSATGIIWDVWHNRKP